MPRLEAERLLAWVLETDRGGVLVRRPDTLSREGGERFEALLRRRERREPLQYLTGTVEFLGLELTVDHRVLIPRPETEGVVEAALAVGLGERARVLDMGTGSGCIAVTLAVRRPGWTVVAIDVIVEPLAVAAANTRRHGVDSRVELTVGDLATLPDAWSRSFDLIVSNPPYVSEEEWRSLEPEVRDHEPERALVSGPTGLEAYVALAPEAFRVLRPGGVLVLELGYRSEAGARDAVRAAGFTGTEVLPDLRSIPRILTARKSGHSGFR